MFAYGLNCPVISIDLSGSMCVMNKSALGGGGNRQSDNSIEEIIHEINNVAVEYGVDTAALGAFLLGLYESGSGIFHASPDCWQQHFGYNDLYDAIFDLGTSMKTTKFLFNHNGEDYVIWVWKGDYVNLGAGAELGIYQGGGPHWRVNPNLSMPMSASLHSGKTSILTHCDNTWWITGFNSNYLNVSADSLTATFALDFSRNPGMYNSFFKSLPENSGWVFDRRTYTASFVF